MHIKHSVHCTFKQTVFLWMLQTSMSGWSGGSLGPADWDWEATGPGGWFRARRRQTGAWLGASLPTTVGSCSPVNILSTASKWNAGGGEEVDSETVCVCVCVYQIWGLIFISDKSSFYFLYNSNQLKIMYNLIILLPELQLNLIKVRLVEMTRTLFFH